MYSFGSFLFFPRKTLGDQRWTFPYQLFFLSSSWPCSQPHALALPGHRSSSLQSFPLGTPCHHRTSLLRQQTSSNPVVLKLEFRGPSPRHTVLLSPQRKTLRVLHTSFWSSRRSSCQCPVFSRRTTTAYCFLIPPKQFDLFFGFFTREKPLQGLQLSWHPSVLTERPFFPLAVLPSTLLPLTLCFCARTACRNGAYMRI